jgi:hypothetical protein
MSSPYSNPYASPTAQPQYGGGMPGPDAKPVAITVFGILNLVFGILGVCGIGFGIFALVVMANNPGFQQPPNPVLDHPVGFVWNIISMGLGTITTFMLIAGGILLLNNKDMGRVLTIVYGWISVVFGFLGIIVMVIIIVGIFGQVDMQDPEEVGAVVGVALGTCFGFIGMVYPVLAIYFMTRPNVKEYLQRVG